MTERTPAGVRALFVWRVAALAWYLAGIAFNFALFDLASRYGTWLFSTVERVQVVAGLILSAGDVGLLMFFASGRGQKGPARPAWTATVLAGGAVAAGLASMAVGHGADVLFRTALYTAVLGLDVGVDLAIWPAVAPLAGSDVPQWRGPVFAVARTSAVLPSLAGLWIFAISHRGLWESPVFRMTRYATIPLHALSAVLLLLLLRRAGWGAHAEATVDASPARAPSGQRDFVVGGLWLGGGLIVTLGSLAMASGGGRYVITTGAIAYGLFRIFRGLGRAGSTNLGS
jgi:hypothetical protein